MTAEAAAHNTEVLKRFDCNLATAIDGSPGTHANYGSGDHPREQLCTLLGHHPSWLELQDDILYGIAYPLEANITEKARKEMLKANLDGGGNTVKVCGACERTLLEGAYRRKQRGRRQSIRRCEECVAEGHKLVLMKKGRERPEADECPICYLPLPLDDQQSWFQTCCMKAVCEGCILAAEKRGMFDCPFCRAPSPDYSEVIPMIQNRVDAGDPVAISQLGNKYRSGEYGLVKDVTRAVELYERAAELGVKEAHYNLGVLYSAGTDVQKDTAKAIRHYEAAAKEGYTKARVNLGCMELRDGNNDIALQHWMIAAKLGQEKALNYIRNMFLSNLATKADYEEALRGYQSATEQMRSPDRDEAERLKRVSD